MWVIPPQQNAAFVCAMERVLDVYQRPYDPAYPVVCLDESPKQRLRESRTPLILPDGSTRYDCEYHRQGVAQVYRLHEPLAGRRRVQVEDRHDRLTFARVVARLLEEDYASAKRVTLVLDNLSAHQPAAFYEVFEPARAHALLQRAEFVFTPKHGSWLNMAEIELAALLPHGLPKRVAERATLEDHTLAWQGPRNQRGAPTNWQFTTDQARIKLKRLYPTTD
jgi:transposase